MSRVYDAELKSLNKTASRSLNKTASRSLNKTASRSLFASAEDDDLEQFASSIVAVMRAEIVPTWWDGKKGKPDGKKVKPVAVANVAQAQAP